MTKVVSLSEHLLALTNSEAGADTVVSCLEWFGQRCEAVEVALVAYDQLGNIAHFDRWAEASLSDDEKLFNQLETANLVPDRRTKSRTEVIELGSALGTRAVLAINLMGRPLPGEILANIESIKSFFTLVLDRTQLKAACALTAQRQADFAELGGDWLWEMDAKGRFTYVSKNLDLYGLEAGVFLGHTLDEIGGRAGADIVAPDWKATQMRLASHVPFRNFFHPVLLPDGGRLWLRSSGRPYFGSDGAFLGFKGVSAELSELVEGERSAREVVEQLTAILDAMPDLVFEITHEGRYTDFMAGPPELMAGAQERLLGKTLEEVLPPDIAALSRNSLRLTLRDGKCPPDRYQLKTAGGWHWFEISGARKMPTRPNGQPTAIFVIRNITEDMLQREEILRLGKIVETMTNLVAIVDQDQCLVWVNKAWEVKTGWALAEVHGRKLASLVRCPDADPECAKKVSAAIERTETFHGETINCDKHGNRYWVDFNILPLFHADGTLQGYVSVETDVTEQKENAERIARLAADEQLTRSRLQNAIEALPDGVIIWDEADRLVAVNSGYKQMYSEIAEALIEGVSQEEILRLGVERRAFPDAWGREADWIAEQYERYRKPTIDTILRADGRSFRRLDLRTSDGGRIAVRIDTTKAQQQIAALDSANLALDETQRSLNRIISSADVGTWEWEVGTEGLRIGGNYAKMLGYSADELSPPSNEMFRSLVHPEDMAVLDSTEDQDFQAMADGFEAVQEHELRMRHKNGSWIWILSRSAVTERHSDGRPKTVVGIHLNVTSRKSLEDKLRDNQSFMTQVMNASISALAVLTEEGVITYANAEAERILGISISTIEGRRYDDPRWKITTLNGGEMKPSDLPFRQAIERQKPVRDVRMGIEWPSGNRQILSVNAVPYTGADGKQLVITSFVNITEDILTTELLEQALTEARQASKSKSSFLANMSHEIRTPLNGVLGMAEILDGLITEVRQKDMIQTIRKSGEVLLNVLNEILDMSKIEAGKMEIETVPFVPNEIVQHIEPLHRLRAEEKGIEFDVLTSSGADLVWLGDQFRIQQILNNLLSNAIKFTEAGTVSLSVSVREGKPFVIEVRDTGIGMTPEQVERIFLSFEQAEGGTTRRFGGTGLGMAIVRNLIDLMGGEITINSSPGQGTTVRVVLPLVQAADGALRREPEGQQPEIPSLAGVRLLVADDSATNRRVLQEMLADTQADIAMVTNGAEAVEEWNRMRIKGEPADILIFDISMPVLDGIGALLAIRSVEGQGPQVPAIAVTANAMSHQVTEYIIAGFDAHVPKPFRRAALLHAITALLPRQPGDVR